jgi:hypothetical protein
VHRLLSEWLSAEFICFCCWENKLTPLYMLGQNTFYCLLLRDKTFWNVFYTIIKCYQVCFITRAKIYLNVLLTKTKSRIHRVPYTRVAMTTFWRTLHHDGKISPAQNWLGGARSPASLYVPSRTKMWCTLHRGQTQSPISTLTLYVLCGLILYTSGLSFRRTL